MKTKTIGLLMVASLVIVGGASLALNRLHRREAQKILAAEALLLSGRASEGLGLLHQTPRSEKTRELEQKALVTLGETGRLAALWRLEPGRFVQDEAGAVLAARGLLQARDPQAAKTLVDSWSKKTQHPSWWLCLRADSLIAQGKRSEAKALLLQAPLRATEDAGRLLRLALLCPTRTAAGRKAAWDYLETATRLAPKDPDVLSFRAQLLEAAGRRRQAEAAYRAAWLAAPNNPTHCELLANFYRRSSDLEALQSTLALGMKACPSDSLRVSLLFWQKMVTPGALPSANPPGGAQALSNFLVQLPTKRFFDQPSFDALPEAAIYAQRYSEVLYLELTQALVDNKLAHAATLLEQAHRQAAWNPSLERALAQLLNQRGQKVPVTAAGAGERHPYLVALDKPIQDPALARLLGTPHALAAAYLASGWWEAALQLAPLTDDLSGFPSWYAYGLAQALRENRGNAAALAFVVAQKAPSAALRLTQAELLRASGKTAEAHAHLATLAPLPDAVGYRATCLLALDALEQHQAVSARQTVLKRPDLAQSETGKALLRAASALTEAKG